MINDIKKGDVVAIRGDKRINNNGQCAYAPDQLIQGKYIRHTGHGGIWTGVVEKTYTENELFARAKVGGGWIDVNSLELIYTIVLPASK